MNKIHLLVIDPQNDFCVDPTKFPHLGGALFVPGADADMDRLAQFVKRTTKRLDSIHVTLDSHHRMDIAHPLWWKDSAGNNPKPFTAITAKDVETGKWMPTVPSTAQRSLSYVRELEKNNKYVLVIWPPHCLIGTIGHCVYGNLMDSFAEFENNPRKSVNFVTKGSNVFTEHYSVFRAEVPDFEDPSTLLNTGLSDTLKEADMVVVAGQAKSHCVASSIRDLAETFGDDQYLSKMVLLTDCMSNVPGFEKQGDEFIAEMVRRGVKTALSTEFLK